MKKSFSHYCFRERKKQMKSLLMILLLIAAISTGSNHLMAQWVQTNGPEGGSATSFAVSGTNLFAGTYGGGVFLSTDNGTSWTPVNNGLWGTGVMSLAVSGTNLFAGTDGSSVFRSTNNGNSWTHVNTGLTGVNVPNLLAVGTNLFAATQKGVFLSTNNGANWDSVNTGLTNKDVRALAVSDTNLFAGTTSGVFRSTNNGANWDSVNTGLPVIAVIALAAKDTNLFAGTGGGGIFRSTDNGATWDSAGLSPHVVLSFTFIDAALFAGTARGVFWSTDNGANWTPADTGLTSTAVGALYVKDSSLFAGTSVGVFRSMNNGVNWTEVNSGMKAAIVTSFAISGSNLFAGTWGGLFRSSNNGDSWESSLKNWAVFSFTISGTNIFVGAGGFVVRSMNNGTTWDIIPGPTNHRISAIVVNDTNLFAGSRGGGVFLSTNNGTDWDSVNTGITNLEVRALAVSDTNLFAGTEGGVFRSNDNGANWDSVNTGLTSKNVWVLLVSDTNLFAGTGGGGVFRSTNNGAHWDSVNTGLTNTYVLSLAVSDTNLFAGTWGGVFLSTNNGANWTAFNTGLTPPTVQTYAEVQDFAIDGTYLYAGNRGTGVWRRLWSEVITNDPPVFTSTLPDTGFMEDTILKFPLSVWFDYVEDIDNADSTLIWSIEGNDSVSTVISSGLVTFSSPLNWYGIDTLSVIVSDGEFSDTAALIVTVNPVNDAPVILEIPPIIFFEDSSYSFDLDTLVIDVDHDTTEISWFASFPANIIANIQQQLNKKTSQKSRQILEVNREESKNINNERENQTEMKTGKIFKQRNLLKIKPSMKNFQSEAITESKEEQSELKVIRQKKKVFSDHTKEPLRVPQISVKFPKSTSSPRISVLSITQGDNDSLIIAIDSLTHLVTINATLNFYGLDIPVIFTAVDDSGASDSDTTKISVHPVNDPPVISQLPELMFNEDDTLIYAISNWFPFINDPDTPDGELSYLVVSGNNVQAEPGDAVYFFHAPQNWFGRDTLQLVVSDISLADTAELYVNVNSINDPPTISNLTDSITFKADSTVSLPLWDYVEDIETPDSLLNYEFTASDDSLLHDYNDSSGVLTFSSVLGFSGIIIFDITVTDDSSATATDSLLVNILGITGIGDAFADQIPKEFILLQNYPNPFNPTTTIKYQLPKATDVSITIYNLLGQKVRTLVNDFKEPGSFEVDWDSLNDSGIQIASGVYIYRIQAGDPSLGSRQDFVDVKKMILMK
jgi:ligand-binding sensor domain-containing protein